MTKCFPPEKPPVAKAAPRKKHVLIIGGGFAGIAAARALKRPDVEVTLIDRRNHHIFQPLLYQVATSVLAPSEIATPIRQLETKQKPPCDAGRRYRHQSGGAHCRGDLPGNRQSKVPV
jgi:NADH:ubiquinone reductase (H+-translocating)